MNKPLLQPCVCGNPIGRAKCCQLKVSSKSWTGITKKVTISDACNLLKNSIQQKNYALGIQISKAVLSKVSNHPKVHYYLGLAQFEQGNLIKAESLMLNAFDNGLQQPDAHLNFANLSCQKGNTSKALRHLQQALKTKPNFLQALELTFKITMQQQRYASAIEYAEQLVKYSPKVIQHYVYLADAYHNNIQDEKALEVTIQGLLIEPENIALLLLQANIYELQNSISHASEIIQQVLQIAPSNISALILKGKLLRRKNQLQKAKILLTKLIDISDLAANQSKAIYAELTMVNKAKLDYQATWRNAELMNGVSNQIHTDPVDIKKIDQYFSQLGQSSLLLDSPNDVPENPKKHNWLFIVGFPRVGSTIVEKCIYEKFECGSASESNAIVDMEKHIFSITKKSWWKLNLNEWQKLNTSEIIKTAHDSYQVQGLDASQCIIDKNLLNLSRLLLISHLLPNSPVIRLVRHPLDIVVSCFLNNFSSHEAWHSNLKLTAQYLLRVEQHWLDIAPTINNPVHILRYEELIHQKTLPCALINFLKQHWSAPTSTDGSQGFTTRTASYAQVSQPINSSGLNTYANYIDMLPVEVVEILSPLVERWGYEI